MTTMVWRRLPDDKITAFVDAWFNGGHGAAFDDYDRDGVPGKGEPTRLLVAAQVGTGLDVRRPVAALAPPPGGSPA